MNVTTVGIADPPKVAVEDDAAGVLRLILRDGPRLAEDVAARAAAVGVHGRELLKGFHRAQVRMLMDCDRRWWWFLPGYGERFDEEITQWLGTREARVAAFDAERDRLAEVGAQLKLDVGDLSDRD